MGVGPILLTVALLPIYLLVRHPYRRLPLHIDTGFYVSNNTVVNGRLAYSRGWNARFAGAGKILPEVLYSLVYLRYGGRDYASKSRFWFSVYNYVTAIVVGALACVLSGGDPWWYCAGLLAYVLLSSEPQHGGYYESGEQFEVLPQAAAVLCLAVGLQGGSWWWCGLAAFIWAAETFAIKLSSAVGFVVLFGLACWSRPGVIVPVVCGGAVAGIGYVVWLKVVGQDLRSLFSSMWGLQSAQSGHFDVRAWTHRGYEKLYRAAMTFVRQPIVPLLVLCGVVAGEPGRMVWLYVAAAAAIYVSQGADIRYYLVVLWPPMALLAAGGAVALLGWTVYGPVVLALMAIVWLAHNVVRAGRADVRSLNVWSWDGALSPAECDRNLALSQAGDWLAEEARGRSLMVYGPFNQAYVLAGASYDTPIICAAHWLDDMQLDWQARLGERLLADPPDLVLDTDRCFAAAAVRDQLGLDYQLQRVLVGGFRLYRLGAVRKVGGEDPGAACKSYAPQSAGELAFEEQRLVLETDAEDPPADISDPHADALAAILRDLNAAGCCRVGIYGAGRKTTSLIDVLRASPVEVAALLDDDQRRHGDDLAGWTIHPLSAVSQLGIDAVVVCSDRFESPMLRRCRPLARDGVTVVGLRRGRSAIPAARDPVTSS